MGPGRRRQPPVDMTGYDELGCLHDMFAAQARRTPDAVAVVDGDGRQMTFSEVDRATDGLAAMLRKAGVGRGSVVGILMERSAEYVVSYIGILKAGGAFMPLEVSYPPQLLRSVLEDARPLVVCTKSQFAARLSPDYDGNHDMSVFMVDEDLLQRLLGLQLPAFDGPPVESNLDDMACTVYSSGTTGKPKGIQCPHRSAVFSYHWRHLAYPYQPDDKEACNVFFIWEMLRPLFKGIPMFIIPDDVIYDPPKLTSFLQRHCITRVVFTPSLLQAVLDFKGIDLKKSFKTMRSAPEQCVGACLLSDLSQG